MMLRRTLLTLLPTLSIGSMMSDTATAQPALDPENTLYMDLKDGRVVIRLRPDLAPKHVERVKQLAREHFYDGIVFHRVIEGFMAQGGDPTGTGNGGSKLPNLKAEFNDLPHVRGAVAMARATENDSANSQFYICLAPALKLDRSYTVWGRVTTGMEFVDAIKKGEPPANPSKIVRASIGSDNVPAPAPSSPIPGALPVAPAADVPMAGMPLPTTPVPTLPPEAPAKPRRQ